MKIEENVNLAALKAVINHHGKGSIGGMSANLADDVLAGVEAALEQYVIDLRGRHPEWDAYDL